jgi:hypothetical protein
MSAANDDWWIFIHGVHNWCAKRKVRDEGEALAQAGDAWMALPMRRSKNEPMVRSDIHYITLYPSAKNDQFYEYIRTLDGKLKRSSKPGTGEEPSIYTLYMDDKKTKAGKIRRTWEGALHREYTSDEAWKYAKRVVRGEWGERYRYLDALSSYAAYDYDLKRFVNDCGYAF